MIQLNDDGPNLEVSGSYGEMQGLISKLKGRGFLWDPAKRVWYTPAGNLTATQVTNLKKLLGIGGKREDASTARAAENAARAAENAARNAELFSEVLATSPLGCSWSRTPGKPGHVSLANLPYDQRDEAKAAGGTWNISSWQFSPDTTDPIRFRALTDTVEKRSKRLAVRVAQVRDYLGSPVSWPILDVKLFLTRNEVHIGGNTHPIQGIIREHLKDARLEGRDYVVGEQVTDQQQLEAFVAAMNKAEAGHPATPAIPPHAIPNSKAGPCGFCGGQVPPREGYIQKEAFPTGIDADEVSTMRWVVYHADSRVCRANGSKPLLRSGKDQHI